MKRKSKGKQVHGVPVRRSCFRVTSAVIFELPELGRKVSHSPDRVVGRRVALDECRQVENDCRGAALIDYTDIQRFDIPVHYPVTMQIGVRISNRSTKVRVSSYAVLSYPMFLLLLESARVESNLYHFQEFGSLKVSKDFL